MEEEVRTILKNGVQENECVGDAAIRVFFCPKGRGDEEFNLPKRTVHDPISFDDQ